MGVGALFGQSAPFFMNRTTPLCYGALLLFLPLIGTVALQAQSVTQSSDYTGALTTINSNVTGSTGNTYTINFNSGLTVTPGTGATLNAGTGNTVNINGNGGALDGGGTLTPMVIDSGTINLSAVTFSNGLGQGGDAIGAGGGAGMGGALFIVSGATVTLNSVQFSGNSAQGGIGGIGTSSPGAAGGNASFLLGLTHVDANGVPTTTGGFSVSGGVVTPGANGGGQWSQGQSLAAGMGGSTASFGTANSGTPAPYGGSAGVNGFGRAGGTGAFGGGNGGNGVSTSGIGVPFQDVGAGGGGGAVGGGGVGRGSTAQGGGGGGGGFGGGGGTGSYSTSNGGGGGGGFGGGGGGISGNNFSQAGGGGGGFGGGADGFIGGQAGAGGSNSSGGGNGAAMGGGIFVMGGANLTLTGNSTFSGNSVSNSNGAAAVGSDLFMMTGSNVALTPGSGNTITFNGTIADDSSSSLSGGTGAGAALTIGSGTTSGGTVVFNNSNTYAGGTTITDCAVIANGANSLGAGAVTVNTGGSLAVNFSGTTTVNGMHQAAGSVDIYSATNFNNAVTVSGGTFTTHEAQTNFKAGLTVSGGTFNNDPTTVQTTDLTITNGTITGGAGSLYQVSGNLSNNNGTGVQLSAGGLEFVASGSNAHTVTWSVDSGVQDIGTLTIDSGQTVDLDNGGNSLAALHVLSFQLTDALGDAGNVTALQAAINAALSGNLTLTYDLNNPANAYLGGQNYTFGDGGLLIAEDAPEPATWALMLMGLGVLAFFGRRLKRNA